MAVPPPPGPCIHVLHKTSVRKHKQQRRRRLRKRHLKSEVTLLQTLSLLFHLVCFVKCWPKCSWSWILKDCIKVQEKKKKVVALCSRPRQNVNLSTFTLQSCNDGKRNVQESVTHVQSCCFANQPYSLFCRSRGRRRRRCLSSLI